MILHYFLFDISLYQKFLYFELFLKINKFSPPSMVLIQLFCNENFTHKNNNLSISVNYGDSDSHKMGYVHQGIILCVTVPISPPFLI